MKIAITGATGALGQHVIAHLQKQAQDIQIIALVRNIEKAQTLFEEHIEIRYFNYDEPDTLTSALTEVDKLLLISANEVGRRIPQHQAVIHAAQQAHVPYIAYTSLLHADQSSLILAKEHKATEQLIYESGLRYTILRNNWYSENYLGNLPHTIQQGILYGAAQNGRISAASRQDYAQAAANVLISNNHDQQIYELAGSESFNLSELAAILSEISKQPIHYQNLSATEYTQALIAAGLPAPVVEIIVDADQQAALGAMYSQSKDLEHLLGRPTTSIQALIKNALT